MADYAPYTYLQEWLELVGLIFSLCHRWTFYEFKLLIDQLTWGIKHDLGPLCVGNSTTG